MLDKDEPLYETPLWKKVGRTFLAMLFYGGVTTVVAYVICFILSLSLEYSFYKSEIVSYVGIAVSLILFPLLFGFKHVENCGYTDSFDRTFSGAAFFGRALLASGCALLIPVLVIANVNFLVIYVYDLCYGPSNCVSEWISNFFFHKYEGTTKMGMFLGTFATFAVYLPIYMPFYYLGRRHYRRDKDFGAKISVD